MSDEVLTWKNLNKRYKVVKRTILEFEGGIPDQATLDTWTAEYDARDKTNDMFEGIDSLFLALMEVTGDLTGKTMTEIKTLLKAKL